MAFDEHLISETIRAAAVVTTAVGIALLLIAGIAELLRRRHATARFVVLADRLVPSALHRSAIAVLSVLAGVVSLTGGRPAAADESIRDWLSPPTTTVTSVHAAPASPPSTSTSSPAPVEPEPSPDVPSTIATRGDRTGRWVRDTEPEGAARTDPTTPKRAATPDDQLPATRTPAPTPTTAAPPNPEPAPTPTPSASSNPRRGPAEPTRTVAPATPTPAPTTAPAPLPDPSRAYMVRPGDCLWNIAASQLPANATNAAIDRAWRAIYAANRDAIGGDPNLIHPGLALTLPTAP